MLRAALIGAYCLVLLAAGIYLGYKGSEAPEPVPATILDGQPSGAPEVLDETESGLGRQDTQSAPYAQSDTPTEASAETSTGTPDGTLVVSPIDTASITSTVTAIESPTEDLTQNLTEVQAAAPAETLRWPARGEVVSGPGWVFSDYYAEWRYISGAEIAVPPGDNITAAMSGTVSAVYDDPLLGTVVILDHKGGLVTEYGRLSSCMLGVGDRVKQGEVIARARGTTVYFGAFENGEVVSVLDYATR